MRYRLVKGRFRLFYTTSTGSTRSAAPDGDSIWFEPNEPKRFDGLSTRAVGFNQGGFAQLRFEGVDALELHFEGKHQCLAQANAARDFAVEHLGFDDVTYGGGSGMLARTAEPPSTPGYILTSGVDPHGRPISFVFAGTIDKRDGSGVELDEDLLGTSLNAALAERGRAYPMFYTSLPVEVRGWLHARAEAARRARRGVWRVDDTTRGARPRDLEDVAVWPKLFRRVVEYLRTGETGATGFLRWLSSHRDRDDGILVDGVEAKMSELVWVSGGLVGLDRRVWGGVVVPR